ncbi:MAG: CAP domain-containing protein, partial [Anaerolineales bacterium]
PESDQVSLCKPEFNQNFETKVIQLINAERNKEGLPLLSEHALLTQAARQHSADMACNQFFSHLSPTMGMLNKGWRFKLIPFQQLVKI